MIPAFRIFFFNLKLQKFSMFVNFLNMLMKNLTQHQHSQALLRLLKRFSKSLSIRTSNLLVTSLSRSISLLRSFTTENLGVVLT